MSNTVTRTILQDGPKYATVRTYLKSDGTTGDEVVLLVDASALQDAPTKLTITQIWFGLTGFSGTINFDATTDSPVIQIPAELTEEFDFRCFGGIPDPQDTGHTGDINMLTSGFSAATDIGFVIVQVRKD